MCHSCHRNYLLNKLDMKVMNKATRNGQGNSRVAEQMNIIGGNNEAKKMAYIKSHDIVNEVLPELFRSKNLKTAAAYLRKYSEVPHDVAVAAKAAGRGALLKGLMVA